MTMMVGGSPVSADRARRAGLVDAVTEERHFATALRQAVAGKVKKNRVVRSRKPGGSFRTGALGHGASHERARRRRRRGRSIIPHPMR